VEDLQARVPHIVLGGHHGIERVRCKVRLTLRPDPIHLPSRFGSAISFTLLIAPSSTLFRVPEPDGPPLPLLCRAWFGRVTVISQRLVENPALEMTRQPWNMRRGSRTVSAAKGSQ
jgi:hypothetical protein